MQKYADNFSTVEKTMLPSIKNVKSYSSKILPALVIRRSFWNSSFALQFQRYVQSDDKIAGLDLKLHASVGHYVEVYPCEIFNPGLFYLHLRKFKKKLSLFMDKLQKFYEHEEIPKLSERPKPKQICAVCYSRHGDLPQWHRGEVEEILGDCLVVVRLVDYGTIAKVLIKNLKLLHPDFISFPKQAVLGSLANIKPFGGYSEWSKSATRRFHELAFYRDLVGGVVSMDSDEYGLCLALSSTMGEEVHINDKLVEEKLAQFDASVEEAETERRNNFSEHGLRVPSPVFFTEINLNTRLQKMFIV